MTTKPEPGQQGGEREQVGIGVGKRRPDEQVDHEAQGKEDPAVGEARRPEVGLAGREHGGEARRDQKRHREQAEQLAVASGHVPPFEPPHDVGGVAARAQLVIEDSPALLAERPRAGTELT